MINLFYYAYRRSLVLAPDGRFVCNTARKSQNETKVSYLRTVFPSALLL